MDTVWNTFLRACSSAYIGYPESMLTDQGSIFLSKEWRFNCDRVDISLQNTGTESHNSLGIGEKYHSILRTIYNKVAHEHPDLARDVALALSVQAMNCTVGPHGRIMPTNLGTSCMHIEND